MRGAPHTEYEQVEPPYRLVVIDGIAYDVDGIDCSPFGRASDSAFGTPNWADTMRLGFAFF
jgi:hypothetical protein